MNEAFEKITDWVFDLDNTLYPRHCDLFSQIDWKMTAYVQRLTGLDQGEARVLQKRLYKEHGTTLNGLMREYSIDPHHYLADVHDIDYSRLEFNPELGREISALPGRKHIFTNGDVRHAENTLAAIGVPLDAFHSVFDIVASSFIPKPQREPYHAFFRHTGGEPTTSVMFEDMPRNLEAAKEMGMLTVLVVPREGVSHTAEAWELDGSSDNYVDHVTDDVGAFLSVLNKARFPKG
ncbi:MAG: pyrimidine 5'-nucleotidase [Rhizobiaceae bacterium]